MQTLTYLFPADRPATRRAHVGVVASGDLEILIEPLAPGTLAGGQAEVRVRTSVDGFDTIWHAVLARFFTRSGLLGRWELNDSGATPGVVLLRLAQAAAAATATRTEHEA